MKEEELQAIVERARFHPNYEDVAKFAWVIRCLKEEVSDREADLKFEYDSRVEAEQKLDDLKDRLQTCESELQYEQLQRNAAEVG